MKRILPFLALLLACNILLANSVSTSFPATENPISQSGAWTNGGTTGLDWTNVRTTPGLAFGTEPGNSAGIYDDSVALLTGTWGPDQDVTGTIFRSSPQGESVFEECELWLRGTITAHSITGYEINTRVRPSTGGGYLQIIRWNGPFGDYDELSCPSCNISGAVTGDVIRATIVGTTIKVYLNGVQVGTTTDSTYSTGKPGMGFFLLGTTGVNSTYGWSSFTATDGISASITSLTPSSGNQGASSLSIAVVGSGTNFVNATTVCSFGTNITINSCTVSSATALTANITIAAGAATGARDATFTTGAEVATSSGGFTVNSGGILIKKIAPRKFRKL